ncbi:MAG: hypothetical protein ACREUG_06265 [Steroidobacteraceae bacterium]
MSGNPLAIALKGFALVAPTILDFISVCRQLPADERRQLEAFEGAPYVADEVAVRFAASAGPRWALVTAPGAQPVIIGGFTWVRQGVWQDWLLSTPAAWDQHWRTVSKVCRRIMDRMVGNEAHRLQCIALADRTSAHAWYRILKYDFEGRLRKFGAKGEDAVVYGRVR